MDIVRWIFTAGAALGIATTLGWLGLVVSAGRRSGWEWPAGIAIASRAFESICVFGAIAAAGLGLVTNRWLLAFAIVFGLIVRNVAFAYWRRHPSEEPRG